MKRRPPKSTRTDKPCPDTTLFRSDAGRHHPCPEVEGIVLRLVLGRAAAHLRDHLLKRQGHHRRGLQLLPRRRLQSRPAAGHQALHHGLQSSQLVVRILDRLGLAEGRSEEHTSELQSLMRNSYAVFCLKKKTTRTT